MCRKEVNELKKMFLVISVLLLISVATNIILYNKSKKADRYEAAVDIALDYFSVEYKIRSVHEALEQAMKEQRLNFGQPGAFNNYYRDELKKVSTIHRELTLLYGFIFDYDQYDRISSLRTNSLFNLLVDCSTFLQYLGENSKNSLTNDGEQQYLNFDQLDDETLAGLEIVTEIIGELSALRSSSYDDKSGSDISALQDYLLRSADYIASAEVQEKAKRIEALNVRVN